MTKRSLVPVLLLAASCAESPPPPPAAPPAPPPQASVAPPPDAPAPAAPAADVTVRRTITLFSRLSGTEISTVHADGTRDSTREIVENGRGPKVTSHVKVSADHTIAAFDATGHEEINQPVDEHFALTGGHATWKSAVDQGAKDVTGPTFYVPMTVDADTFGLLAEALIAAGGTLAILPEGQARAEKVGEATVLGPNKESKKLIGWAVTGLGLIPRIAWVDEAGAYWGYVDDSTGVVPEGWEKAIAPLVVFVQTYQKARDAAAAQQLAHKPPKAGLAIAHVRVLDVVAGKWLEDQTVVVVGSKIRSIGPSKTAKLPTGAEIYDATGKALVPGLWDMHAHLDRSSGPLYVGAGVTTVRDVGNLPDFLDDLKQRFDAGAAIGPHVLKAGFIEGRGPEAAASVITAETEDEAKAGVEEYFKRGYVQMKIYNSIKPELVPTIAKAAHAHGMRVSGHVPVHMLAAEAVRAGYDEINHMNMLFLNFLADHETDTRTTLRFSLVAEKASGLDLGSKPVADFLALLKEKKTVVDPTLNVFENLFLDRPGQMGFEWAAVADRMPAGTRRGFLLGGLPVPDGKEQTYKDAFTACLKMTKALYDQKTPIVAGTDSLGSGLEVARELELYAMAGIPNDEVVRSATITPAKVMKVDKATGSIAAGKDADLVVVTGDPLKDVGDLRKVVETVRAGVVFAAPEVLATVGVKPATP